MNCIIIDDEVLARRLLIDYISKVEDLEAVAQFESPLQAQQILTTKKIDLLFLDINMPGITGIDFLKTLKEKPLTILTTAYSEYAIQGYELDVIDYLLKPISFERFYQSVNKATEYLKHGSILSRQQSDSIGNGYFYVKSDYKIIRIDFKDILFVEGLREYVQIYTNKNKIITHITMQKLSEILPYEDFFRIHKSHIVNMKQVKEIEGNLLKIEDYKLVISKGQRKELFDRIEHLLIN